MIDDVRSRDKAPTLYQFEDIGFGPGFGQLENTKVTLSIRQYQTQHLLPASTSHQMI